MIETILWRALPIACSLAIAYASIKLAFLGRSVGQFLGAALTGAVLFAANYRLAYGWPSFLPHLTILATVSVLFAQAAAIVRAAERHSTLRATGPTKVP